MQKNMSHKADSTNAFYIIDICNGKTTREYNSQFLKMIGLDGNITDLSDMDFTDFIYKDDLKKYVIAKKSVSEENPFENVNLRLIKMNRSVIFVNCGIYGTTTTDGYKRIIHAISETAADFIDFEDDAFQSVSPILFKFYIDDTFPDYYTGSFLKLIGYTESEIAEKKLKYTDIIEKDDIEHFVHAIKNAQYTNDVSGCTVKIKDKNSKIHFISCSFKKLSSDDHYLGIANDVTIQKEIEKDLSQSHEIIHDITKNINCVIMNICIKNGLPELLYINDTFSSMLGYSSDDINSNSNDIARLFIHPDDYSLFINSIQNKSSGPGFECRAVKSNKETIWITVSSSKSEAIGHGSYICTFQDISHIKKIELELSAGNEQYAKIINCLSEIAFKIDLKEKLLQNYDIFTEKYQLPKQIENMPEGLLETDLISKDSADTFYSAYNKILEGSPEETCVLKLAEKIGNYLWVKFSMTAVSDETGTPVMISGTVSNVSEQLAAEESLFHEVNSSALMTPLSVMQYIVNLNEGRILSHKHFREDYAEISEDGHFNAAFLTELLSAVHDEEKDIISKQLSVQNMWNIFLQGRSSTTISFRMRNTSRKYFWIYANIQFVKDKITNNVIVMIHFSQADFSKQVELNMLKKSEQNKASGLLSKAMFRVMVNEFFKKEQWNGSLNVLFILEIIGLKKINNTLGHDNGEKIVLKISEYFQSIKSGLIIGKLFGERLMLFVKDVESYDELNLTANKICDCCKEISVAGIDTQALTVHAGAAFAPVHGNDFDLLFKKAEEALSELNHSDQNGCVLYSEAQSAKPLLAPHISKDLSNMKSYNEYIEKIELVGELKNAVHSGQICTYVQPQYNINDEKYISLEALVRWNHPQKGIMTPDKFIGLAEENGLISEIDLCVLDQICSYIRTRLDNDMKILPIAVNQSGTTVKSPDYFNKVTSIIKKYNISPENIELEITEKSIVTNFNDFKKIISRLKDFGFRISLDDFGSGFSSLEILSELPIDILKLGRKIISRGLSGGSRPKEIIRTIASIASALNVEVICEGIESAEEHTFIKEIGCTLAQGYLFGKPTPCSNAEQFIHAS